MYQIDTTTNRILKIESKIQHPSRFGNPALNAYFYIVKNKSKKVLKADHSLREQILQSMMASFKIERINIPIDVALASLKKVELNLGK